MMERPYNYLGASDAPIIIGVSPWKSAYELFMEKIGEKEPEGETLPMRVGTALEPVVLKLFEEHIGVSVTDRQKRILHPSYPFIGATLDGVIPTALVEAKTASSHAKWGEDGSDEIPLSYFIQTQTQMAVTGYKLVYVPVLFQRNDFRVYLVRADLDLMAQIIEKMVAFWKRIQDRDPPEPSSLSDLAMAYPRDTGKAVVASDDIEGTVLELASLKSQEKIIGQSIEELEAKIKVIMRDASTLVTSDGRTLATWKSQRSSRFDSSLFRTDFADLYSQYQKQSDSRVFRLKTNKGEKS